MNRTLRTAFAVAGLAVATQAAAQVTFYENEGFQGRTFTTQKQVGNFERYGFNDRASSVVVARDRWEVCDDARFAGRCVVLRPGRYASLAAMGLDDRISSVRMVSTSARVEDSRYAPGEVAGYDSHRRNHEHLYEANVTSVRGVIGTSGNRCWVEREQVARGHRDDDGPAAGGVVGGILGHQVGAGHGRAMAGSAGAVGDAAMGGHMGREGGGRETYAHDVERCETASSGRPEYWDVTYTFRGTEHRVQMTNAPGNTVTVNERGEPRA